MKIQNALVSNILDRSQRYFAHLTTVTLSWRVQNIVVIGRVCFTLECFEFSSNFEFDRNMLSGTGARAADALAWCVLVEPLIWYDTNSEQIFYRLLSSYSKTRPMWHMYASANYAIIGSDNSLLPGWRQCWNIINRTLRNKFQWNFNQISYIFINEIAFDNVISEMTVILSSPQCVKSLTDASGKNWL